jgi:hypothetical protein
MGGGARPTRTLAAWEVQGTGEKMSTQSLNKRLEHHKIEPGTLLHHPKNGTKVVVGSAGRDLPYELAVPA